MAENTTGLFEHATRLKVRFSSTKGNLTVEDLWDLTPESLDTIFRVLNKAKKTDEGESLLHQRSKANVLLDLKIELVKYIVLVKLQEAEARKNARLKADQKKELLGILAEKQNEELRSLPKEKILGLINDLSTEDTEA